MLKKIFKSIIKIIQYMKKSKVKSQKSKESIKNKCRKILTKPQKSNKIIAIDTGK